MCTQVNIRTITMVTVEAILLTALLAGCTSGAEVVAVQEQRDVQLLTVHSPAVADNQVGESAERLVSVYLPPSYGTMDSEYPVVYYLHGFGQSPLSVARFAPYLDSHFEQNPQDEFVLVGIDGSSKLGGSFWRNSPLLGRWEDFVVQEVPRVIQDRYRVRTGTASRGIAGFSMGGDAALHIGLRHPDRFGAIFVSGPAATPLEAPERYALGGGAPKRRSKVAALAYEAVMDGDEMVSGALDNVEITDQIVELIAVRSGARAVDRLLQSKNPWVDRPGAIHIEFGSGDVPWLKDGARDISAVLEQHGVDHEVVEFTGGHGLPGVRVQEVMIPFFARELTP